MRSEEDKEQNNELKCLHGVYGSASEGRMYEISAKCYLCLLSTICISTDYLICIDMI